MASLRLINKELQIIGESKSQIRRTNVSHTQNLSILIFFIDEGERKTKGFFLEKLFVLQKHGRAIFDIEVKYFGRLY